MLDSARIIIFNCCEIFVSMGVGNTSLHQHLLHPPTPQYQDRINPTVNHFRTPYIRVLHSKNQLFRGG
jgi:hypothetical protein